MSTLFTVLVLFLTPCQYEDSDNCYWDAATMGNGVGTSFVNVNGNLYLID